MASPTINSEFVLDFDSFARTDEKFCVILNLFISQELKLLLSSRSRLQHDEFNEFYTSINSAEDNVLLCIIHKVLFKITDVELTVTFNLPTGSDKAILTNEEIGIVLKTMRYKGKKPSNMEKREDSEEYQFLLIYVSLSAFISIILSFNYCSSSKHFSFFSTLFTFHDLHPHLAVPSTPPVHSVTTFVLPSIPMTTPLSSPAYLEVPVVSPRSDVHISTNTRIDSHTSLSTFTSISSFLIQI
ncbi:hypothetical protein KSP40_PGU016102 [Platanthera guangdongensis]|uniref:Uncharacterized protein n=1 Tax=Platanthera guangdongensis TaxID=2320717 RepID=A0ABR2LKL7_9ASPA